MPALTAKHAILEIIRKSDGEFTGKTRLHKALYFAHLIYFDLAPGYLTDAEFARMPQGPGIDGGERILHELQDEGLLEFEAFHEGPYPDNRYRLTAKGKTLPIDLSERASTAIQRAVDFVQPRTAGELSQLTHEYSRSWNLQEKLGGLLDIYIDVIPDDEYQKRQADIKEMEPAFDEVLRTLEG
jgi:Protein of unknown function (DUF4065)